MIAVLAVVALVYIISTNYKELPAGELAGEKGMFCALNTSNAYCFSFSFIRFYKPKSIYQDYFLRFPQKKKKKKKKNLQ